MPPAIHFCFSLTQHIDEKMFLFQCRVWCLGCQEFGGGLLKKCRSKEATNSCVCFWCHRTCSICSVKMLAKVRLCTPFRPAESDPLIRDLRMDGCSFMSHLPVILVAQEWRRWAMETLQYNLSPKPEVKARPAGRRFLPFFRAKLHILYIDR